MAALLLIACQHGPEVYGLGTVASLVRIAPSEYRLMLEHPAGLSAKWPGGETIDVDVVGELPDTVCDGTRVYVYGTSTAHGLVATVVAADRGKYDGCFEWQCHPAAYDACRGRSRRRWMQSE